MDWPRQINTRLLRYALIALVAGTAGVHAKESGMEDKGQPMNLFAPRETDFIVEKKYLVLPVDNQLEHGKTEVVLSVDGKTVRKNTVPLAASAEAADWYAFYTTDAYRGRQMTVVAKSATEEGFALIRQSDVVPGEDGFYREPHRPQFHFTQKVGWNNDPNGMVYHNGTWHLFFQHNPVSRGWGNMTWGHATSEDLLHWEQQPDKLHAGVSAKGACYSGGATVDKRNTGGFGDNALIAFFTDTAAGECLAYSTDNGETLIPYEGNPLISHDLNDPTRPSHKGRDPKVIWYAYDDTDIPLNEKARELGGHWVMAVYVFDPDKEKEAKNKDEVRYIAFYTSTDMKDWTLQSKLQGYHECPELFALPIDGDQGNTRWVVFAADGRYTVGQFDGRTFTPGHEGKHQAHYGPFYASQTFEHAPDGRRIQMGWLKINTPDGPYNQHFSFPYQLTLTETPEGVRMRVNPIEEIEQLRICTHRADPQELRAGTSLSLPVGSDLLDVTAELEVGDVRVVRLALPGRTIAYDIGKRVLNDRPLEPVDGRVVIRVLADRILTEIFGNHGAICVIGSGDYGATAETVSISADGGGSMKLHRFEASELKSIWW